MLKNKFISVLTGQLVETFYILKSFACPFRPRLCAVTLKIWATFMSIVFAIQKFRC